MQVMHTNFSQKLSSRRKTEVSDGNSPSSLSKASKQLNSNRRISNHQFSENIDEKSPVKEYFDFV